MISGLRINQEKTENRVRTLRSGSHPVFGKSLNFGEVLII
jgi:hypothetical protein